MDPKQLLKTYFGYDSFREGQEPIINALLSGKDALAIMPTGAGKSLCYQIPAVMLPGVTLVISPLISLMMDQTKTLNAAGIRTAYINSSLTPAQITKALNLAAQGTYKLIYVAPERLENEEFIQFAHKAKIAMVTVDEAHCISQWGQDFRPSYVKIVEFVKQLPQRPIVSAFTATATTEVKQDILKVLNLIEPEVTVTGFDRRNLYYRVQRNSSKDRVILDFVQKHADESGIIYCATRKNVENVYTLLASHGVAVTRYHAGLEGEERKQNQTDFIYDRKPVIVATNAFGMGIDKSNVRYVLHYNMPQSMESYYQEAGRGGRDGESAQCVLLFSAQDVIINKFLLENKDFSAMTPQEIEFVKQRDAKRLKVMENYCQTTGCLRNFILSYFGEQHREPCGHCGNCDSEYKTMDLTTPAKNVIRCVAEMQGRYGITVVTGTLLGAQQARLKEIGAQQYTSYGALKGYPESLIRTLIQELITRGYLHQTGEQYPVLQLGNYTPLKQERTRVILKLHIDPEPGKRPQKRRASRTNSLSGTSNALFEELRRLRARLAKEESLPPYVIFSDKTLIEMCLKLPENQKAMLNVSGVGVHRMERYGKRFLNAIAEFTQAHPKVTKRSASTTEDRAQKPEFYLTLEDAENFVYKDHCFISEIRDELNRICTVCEIQKATNAQIWDCLVKAGLGYVEVSKTKNVKHPTSKGLAEGIVLEQRLSRAGTAYSLMKYPISIQKRIVKALTQNNPNPE